MKTSIFISLLYILCFVFELEAQTIIQPAEKQTKSKLIKHATLHVGNGKVIEDGAIGFEKGKIIFVGKTEEAKEDNFQLKTDYNGQHIYPGFIQPDSQVGLVEVDALKATRDYQEVGLLNPNLRTLIAYNTDSEIIPTMRFNGILTAQISPTGGLVSGRSSVMRFEGWNWEDAVLKADDGLFINWPSRINYRYNWMTGTVEIKENKKYQERIEAITSLLAEGEKFIPTKGAPNLKLQAVKGLFDGSMSCFIRTNQSQDIIDAVNLCKKFDVKSIIIVGGRQALDVVSFLKRQNVPVIYTATHQLPYRRHYDLEDNFKTAGLLHKAGVLVSLGVKGSAMTSRNLPFLAGNTVAYGVDKETALQMITLNTAKILHIDKNIGSLEIGKAATFFVSKGDALDMRTNKITAAYIDGKRIQLYGTQQLLYDKYKDKYEKNSE